MHFADCLNHIYGGLLPSSSITLTVLQISRRPSNWFDLLFLEAQSPVFALCGTSWFKLFYWVYSSSKKEHLNFDFAISSLNIRTNSASLMVPSYLLFSKEMPLQAPILFSLLDIAQPLANGIRVGTRVAKLNRYLKIS